MKQFVVVLNLHGEREEIPVYADDIEDALIWAEEEYGEDAVQSIRTRVLEMPTEFLKSRMEKTL